MAGYGASRLIPTRGFALIDFTEDEKTKQILELILSRMDMDRPILAPPGTAPDKVTALRKAFHEAMNDPGLIADAKKASIDLGEADATRSPRFSIAPIPCRPM